MLTPARPVMLKRCLIFLLSGLVLSMVVLISGPGRAWAEKLSPEWGGQVRLGAGASWPGPDSYFKPVGLEPLYDGSLDFRLKNKLFFGRWGYFETHYEAVLTGGDTRRKLKELAEQNPVLLEGGRLGSEPINDDCRFMDLTRTIDEDTGHALYHRLDRFALTWQPGWGTVRLGRQAVTWGHGLLFNPLDLFSPFSPTDFQRDYKVGDDMVYTQVSGSGAITDVELLYVPRRDPIDHKVKWAQSSLAGKVHLAWGETGFDLVAGSNYKNFVLGLGAAGYLGGAAWRCDGVYTFLDPDQDRDGYLALVANIDYSWVWLKKNFYGFVEFYYNGLGEIRSEEVFTDPDLAEALARGGIFTVGRTYLCGSIKMEATPLFSLYLTVINNLADPSGLLQPRAVWNAGRNVDITLGADVYYGPPGTEYGGLYIPGTDLISRSPDSAYLWATRYF